MTPLEWLMLIGACVFIALLTRTANDMKGTEDDNDYNSERGVSEGDKPSGQQDEVAHGQGATGPGAGGHEPPTAGNDTRR